MNHNSADIHPQPDSLEIAIDANEQTATCFGLPSPTYAIVLASGDNVPNTWRGRDTRARTKARALPMCVQVFDPRLE